ncbi:MAG TPA: hypothetical protein VLA99_10465 [Nitrospiraceae bacterium]|nr:hypothetical protein [Nitrospiraceae bacterium]
MFPNDDPLSRDLLRLLAVDADLQATRELEEELSLPDEHSISKTKWQMRWFFLHKLRVSFLWNAINDIITKQYRDRPSLHELLRTMNEPSRKAYQDLRNSMRELARAQEVISRFRNSVAFHYDDPEVAKKLADMSPEEGELVRNIEVGDIHAIVAYQILDRIPSLRFSSDSERQEIMEQIDLIEGKPHVFTWRLFIDYIQTRNLEHKILCTPL